MKARRVSLLAAVVAACVGLPSAVAQQVLPPGAGPAGAPVSSLGAPPGVGAPVYL